MSDDKKIDYEKEVKARLEPHHIQNLEKSCLSYESMYKAEYKSDKWDDKYPCWSIEFNNPVTGKLHFKRARLDTPLVNKKEASTTKYLQPKGSGCQLYFSKQLSFDQWKKQLNDISIGRFLIEGEKKTDCAIQYADNTAVFIGLTGVNGWSKQGHLIDSLDQYVALPRSQITICVDSDYKTNPNIQKAVQGLGVRLLEKEIKVSLIVIPGDPDNPDVKVGLDDHLSRFQEEDRSDEFKKLIESKSNLTKSVLQEMKKETKEQLKMELESPLSFMGMVNGVLDKYHIESDKFGSFFCYQEEKKYFRELTSHEINKIALDEDLDSLTTKKRREEVLTLLKSKTLNPVLHEKWRNISDYQVPVKNGIIDLPSKTLLEHSVEHYLESVIEANWVPNATNPKLEQFLLETFEDDVTKIETLQEFAGYSLMPCASAKKALFAIGPSNTGKSVIGHLLTNLHGRSHVSSISIKQMADPVALSELVGKSLNIVPEIEFGEAIPDAIFKTLIGTEEAITVRKLYVGFVKYYPYTKHIFLCNNMPIIKDPSNGTINRILPLQFVNVVPSFNMDLELPQKILAEKEGLLNWCVEGALRLLANNFQFTLPKSSIDILHNYKKSNQTFEWFIDQFFTRDSASKVGYQEAWSLLQQVRDGSEISSELYSIRSEKQFSKYLEYLQFHTPRVPDPEKQGGKKRVILGLKRKKESSL